MKKTILIIVLFALYCNPAIADVCSISPGGNYDDILNAFINAATTWNVKLLPLVTRIFWGIFAAEFLYQLTFKKILSNDVGKLYVFFVIRMFTAYVFAYIFLNLQTYIGIIGFFTRIGADLGGSTISVTHGSGGMGITPSGIMNLLECKFKGILLILTAGAVIPLTGGMQTFFGNSLLVVIILMNLVAVTMVITMLDAYIVLFGGFILVGFSGSSWTQSYWQKYLSYAVGTGIRLFTTCLILGLIVTAMQGLSLLPTPNALFTLLGVLIMSVYLLMTVPSKAASMLTGSMGGGMGELVGAASMVMAGGSIAKLAGGAAKSKAGALSEILNGGGKNPSPSSLKMNTTTPSQAAKGADAAAGKTEAMSKSMNKGETAQPKPTFNDSLNNKYGSTSGDNSGSSGSSSSQNAKSSNNGGGSGGSTPKSTSSTSGNSNSLSPSSKPSSDGSGASNSANSASSRSSGSTSSSNSSSSGSSSGNGGDGSSEAPNPTGNSGSIGSNQSSSKPTSAKSALAQQGKKFADSVGKVNSGHAGAADVNINPHKE